MNPNGMIPVLVPPQFAKFMAEFFGDKRGVLWPVANISKRTFNLDVAQTSHEVAVEGDFIYADPETNGTMYVQFNDPAMPWIPIKTNMSISGFPIRRIFAKWDAQAGQVVNLLYGYGAQIIPPNQEIASISSGIDGILGDQISVNDEAFMVGGSAGLVAGQFTNLQLWNPVGSGVVAYVDAFRASFQAAAEYKVWVFNAALANVMFPQFGLSKNRGGAVNSLSEFRSSNTAAPAVSDSQRIFSVYSVANGAMLHEFKPAIRLPAGTSIVVSSSVVAQPLAGTFEWREKLV